METRSLFMAASVQTTGKTSCAVLHYGGHSSAARVAAQQIVGRERRERVSQLAWCGEGCFDSRRRVNSTVGPLPELRLQITLLRRCNAKMSFKLPIISDAADYSLHFNDDVWQQAAATICARHRIPCERLRRSSQGENVIFFVDEHSVIKIFAPFRENYSRETAALEFAQGKLSIKTPDLMHTGEIDGWSYLVMTRLPGQASREVWASVGQRNRLEIVSRLGLAISELHKYAAPLQTASDR